MTKNNVFDLLLHFTVRIQKEMRFMAYDIRFITLQTLVGHPNPDVSSSTRFPKTGMFQSLLSLSWPQLQKTSRTVLPMTTLGPFGIHQRHQQTLRALVHSIQLTDKIVWGLGCANGLLGRWDKLILHHVGQARPRHEAFVWKCSIAAAQDMGTRFPAFFGKVEASGHFQCVTRAAQSQRFCEVFGV